MIYKILTINIAVVLLLSCKSDGYLTKPTGVFYQSTSFDNLDRDYILYVPSTYDENSSLPLVFNLHGGAMTARDQMEQVSDMRSLADSENFILVYPQSTNENGIPIWNLGGENSKATDVDDVGYISHLINKISNFYSINLDRVYVVGFSNGGYLSFELACKLSEEIAAFASVAGHMFIDTYNECMPTHPTPFLSINGTEDNYEGIESYYLSIENSNNYWIEYNKTDLIPVISDIEDINTFDGSTVQLFSWINGKNGVEIDHYKILGGGHSWPSLNTNSDKDMSNGDIDSNKIIWEFFSRFDINGLR